MIFVLSLLVFYDFSDFFFVFPFSFSLFVSGKEEEKAEIFIYCWKNSGKKRKKTCELRKLKFVCENEKELWRRFEGKRCIGVETFHDGNCLGIFQFLDEDKRRRWKSFPRFSIVAAPFLASKIQY